MKISTLHENNTGFLKSFEIFPPKGELDFTGLDTTLSSLAGLNPAFISVTYSAGGTGGNSEKTSAICKQLNTVHGTTAMAHLTCINSTKESVKKCIDLFKADGIENVLALRGDLLEGATATDFHHASDLIPLLKDAGFCVGAACYPEGHVSCDSVKSDTELLKVKQDAGADFFVSQLFFDNYAFLKFYEDAFKVGITKPIEPGVMPIMSKSQVSRMVFMCGASLPSEIVRILNRYETQEDIQKAGVEYAGKQILALKENGINCAHIYTMNKPDVAKGILEVVGE